jgi:hypothetical protein
MFVNLYRVSEENPDQTLSISIRNKKFCSLLRPKESLNIDEEQWDIYVCDLYIFTLTLINLLKTDSLLLVEKDYGQSFENILTKRLPLGEMLKSDLAKVLLRQPLKVLERIFPENIYYFTG